MKRLIAGLLTVVATLGVMALVAPTPVAEARPCVLCPDIVIECGGCYEYVARTCEHCAYCQKIKGCH